MNACKPTTRWARNFHRNGRGRAAWVSVGDRCNYRGSKRRFHHCWTGRTKLQRATTACSRSARGSSISSSNPLNCTANDVKISKATNSAFKRSTATGLPTGTPTCGTPPPAPGADPVTWQCEREHPAYGEVPSGRERELALRRGLLPRGWWHHGARDRGVGGSVSGQCSLTNLRVGGDTPLSQSPLS